MCFIGPDQVLSNALMSYPICQWMGSGSRGLCGRAVLKPVEGGASRGTGFVMGPSSEVSPVLENERRSGAVMSKILSALPCLTFVHCSRKTETPPLF